MNKTALVIGGSSGVGLSLVRALVDQHYDVYFVGRNSSQGIALEKTLRASREGSSATSIEFINLDLQDLKSVNDFCLAFNKKGKRLDRIVFSAGVLLPQKIMTEQNLEATFTTAYLSSYLIIQHLLPAQIQHQQAPENDEHEPLRILMVTGNSSIVLKERLNFNNLNAEQSYAPFRAAFDAVHAKTVLAQIIHQDYPEAKLVSHSFLPGIVRSNLGRSLPWPINKFAYFFGMVLPKKSHTGLRLCFGDADADLDQAYHSEGSKKIALTFSQDYLNNLRNKTDQILEQALKEG